MKVKVDRRGAGVAVQRDAIVRARVRRLDAAVDVGYRIETWTPPNLHHGRVPATAAEKVAATPIDRRARVPQSAHAAVVTLPVSCFECMSAGLLQLNEGSTATVECPQETWQVEVLAVGDARLFERDLLLPRSPGP